MFNDPTLNQLPMPLQLLIVFLIVAGILGSSGILMMRWGWVPNPFLHDESDKEDKK